MPPATPNSAETVPASAHSGRGAYFHELIRTRPAEYTLVLGCGCAFLLGAYLMNPLIMVIAPAAVAALVLVTSAVTAGRRAAQSFFKSFAAGIGFEYVDRWDLLAFTPLLGAGNRHWCRHWMLGDVVKEPRLSGGLGHFFYERREDSGGLDGEQRGRVKERGHFTICAIDIERSLPLFKGVFLRQRRGLFELHRDWLENIASDAVELESAAFTERYELRAAVEQDELLLRELLSPTLVSWLAGHPLAPGFELRAGELVVFVPRLLEDAGNLTFFLDAAREIAGRVVREVEEANRGQPRPLTSRTATSAGR
jgi:hypothetical protein